jgi:Tol biopolymer transport system component
MSIAPGTRIGPYEVGALLGAGGMGEVYRARDSRLGRDVAVKVLPAAFSENQDRLSRFELEARAASALNHPSILTIHDIGVHDGAPYIVCELLEGASLRERLGVKPLAQRKAVAHAVQIAHGLAAAHDKGIVHRDIKPENLFVTTDGRVKILDFGLAKLVRRERHAGQGTSTETLGTDPGTLLGTVGYMSPEQVRGQDADHRSDLFSLGVVLYEMLSGRRAFKGETAVQTMNAILTQEPPDLATANPAVAPDLERIVRRCLEKDPQHRFRSAHDLAFALEAVSGISASGSAAGAAPLARRRSLLAALAVLVVLALIGAAFLGGRRTAEPPLPLFQRLTFRRGAVMSARYAPDGQTVVYSASWAGDPMLRLFSTRVEGRESTRLDLPEASLFGISRAGELALALHHPFVGFWDGGILARVPLGGGTPRAVLDDVLDADWSADGNAFVVVRKAGDRARLEYPIGKTPFEDDRIWNPRVSPSGDRVAFWHGAGAFGMASSVAVMDRTGNKTELSGGWTWARGLAWAPAGNELWFTARKGGPMAMELWAAALSGKARLLTRIPSWMEIEDIAPDGRVLLTLGTLRIGATCLPPGVDRERSVSWFEASRVQDLSPDGKTLLFSEEGAGEKGSLYVMNTTEAAAPIRLGEAGLGAALSADARWAAVRHAHEIVLLPTGAGEPRKLDLSSVTPVGIRWFRDGKRCAFAGVESGHPPRTYILDIESGGFKPVGPVGAICVWPSPDGRELLCNDVRSGKWTVFSLERGEGRPAPGLEPREEVLDWARDGAAYIRAAARESPEIYRLDLRTGRRTLWRRMVFSEPAGLMAGGPEYVFASPEEGGSYCYSAWWLLSDLYQVTGLK